MKLLVDRLTDSPEPFEFEADSAWWEEAGASFGVVSETLVKPFRFALRAYKMGEEIFLEGEAGGVLAFECSRCLTRYRETIQESFRVLLEPAGTRLPAEPDAAKLLASAGMCLGDELETGWYLGSEIGLEEFFREVVALGLPAKPLCREECLGLCPQCGVDRNKDSCTCTEANVSSPFAVLKKLRDTST